MDKLDELMDGLEHALGQVRVDDHGVPPEDYKRVLSARAAIRAHVDGMTARIAELEQAQAWISVDDRLPEHRTIALVSGHYPGDKGADVAGAVFIDDDLGKRWLAGDFIVTHWRLMPPPPQ